MRMLRDNFELAIKLAILYEEARNRQEKHTFESGFLQGLRDIKRAVERGEEIEIRET